MDGFDRTFATTPRRIGGRAAAAIVGLMITSLALAAPAGVSAAVSLDPAYHVTGMVQCHSTNTGGRQLYVGGPSVAGLPGQASTTVLADAEYRMSWDGKTWGSWSHAYRYAKAQVAKGGYQNWTSMTFVMPRYTTSYAVQVRIRFHWYDNAAGWRTVALQADTYETFVYPTTTYAFDSSGCVIA